MHEWLSNRDKRRGKLLQSLCPNLFFLIVHNGNGKSLNGENVTGMRNVSIYVFWKHTTCEYRKIKSARFAYIIVLK